MRINVRPGKREGRSKTIFDEHLEPECMTFGEEGELVLSILTSDVYTAKSTQQYEIAVEAHELEMFCEAVVARRRHERDQMLPRQN